MFLLSHLYKLFRKITLDRLSEHLDGEQLGELLEELRHHIFTAARLIEQAEECTVFVRLQRST